MALCLQAQEKTPAQKTITVTGTAEAEVVPDEIYVQVDLREYDKRGVGKIDIETIKTNFLAACKSIGLADSDVSVLRFQGDDTYWQYKRGRKKEPDLKTGISYWVKVTTTKKLDELVDKLDDEDTQNFTIAKTAYSKSAELKKQLYVNAIKAAKDKAIYLTSAIGEHIGEAITIADYDQLYDEKSLLAYNRYIDNIIREDHSGSPANVGFKKMKFQFQVNVVFALK
jgi:uncharacterized protein YggE